jgi:hypothetical protein
MKNEITNKVTPTTNAEIQGHGVAKKSDECVPGRLVMMLSIRVIAQRLKLIAQKANPV